MRSIHDCDIVDVMFAFAIGIGMVCLAVALFIRPEQVVPIIGAVAFVAGVWVIFYRGVVK